MNTQNHWEQVYQTKAPDAVSWFRQHLERSLALIEKATPNRAMSVIDVGGGESTLVDDLLRVGYRDIGVLDISQVAIGATKRRLGPAGDAVTWWVADVTQVALPTARYDVWHDRGFSFSDGRHAAQSLCASRHAGRQARRPCHLGDVWA